MKKPLFLGLIITISFNLIAQEEGEKKDTLNTSETEKIELIEDESENSRDDRESDIIWRERKRRYERRDRHYHRRSDKREIRTLSRHSYHSGGFGALSFKWGEFEDETAVLAGVRAGWIINRAVAIGFEGYGIIPTAEFDNISPVQKVVLLGGYGGMFIEPIIFSNQIVHVTFPVSAGAGWMGYHYDLENNINSSTDDLLDDDVFWYLEPGVTVEVNVSRHFRIAMGASKRFTEDLELLNTPTNAFDGTNYTLTLKFGRF